MFDTALDAIIIGLLVLNIVMFAIGKGDVLMNLFNGSQADEMNRMYDRKKMDRASLILCIVLLISELLMKFLSATYGFVVFISLGIAIVAFVIYIAYMQKIRKY